MIQGALALEFKVRAFEEDSQQVLGLHLVAKDEADARAQVRIRGLTLLSISRVRQHWLQPARRQHFDVALFAQELHTLTRAGLGIVESLEAMVEKESQPTAQAVLGRLLVSLREGQKLSDGMLQQGTETFPALLIGIVRAAESTGNMADAFERHLSYDQRVRGIRQQILSAAIYPAVLCAVGLLVTAFLMGWVVPRFAAVYRGTGRALPWASQLLLDWGQLINGHGLSILVSMLIVGPTLWIGTRLFIGRGWRLWIDRLPGLARLATISTLARLYLTLGLLLRSGLPIQQALAMARAVLPAHRQAAAAGMAHIVALGYPLSEALAESGLSSPIALRFVRAGERSGQLAEMLTQAALYHDSEIARWVDRFSRLFEPVLMALIGLVIGGIVLLLYMPVFDLAGSLQ